jgi:hypothetical protein
MIDVEQHLRRELDQLVPLSAALDWDEVLARAGRTPRRRISRRSAFALAVALIAIVAFATPVGATLARGLGDFSAWVTGEPGSPASKQQQRAFDAVNARSWLGFPQGTKLRRFVSLSGPAPGQRIELSGFRSGTTLCLRVIVVGKTRAGTQSCAPLAELGQAGAPVRVVLVDHGFGQGTKRAWYGVDRFRAPALQVTAGIAADGVRRVILQDESGRHTVSATRNAFLYVAPRPAVGQRVQRIWAETARGRVVVPFAPAPFGLGGSSPTQAHASGPTRIQRRVTHGTIGWLDRHEPRGRPLDVLPTRGSALVRRHTVFGRVVAPDPSRPVRVALTLSTSRHGGKATGLCSWLIMRGGGGGGGCSVRATLFATSPITTGLGLISGSDQFATLSGLASDDVARIVAFLANGQREAVPFADNVYLVDIARSKLPVRLAAYDKAGRVIGLTPPIGDIGGGAGPAPGKARPLLHGVSGNGATAELLVGRSTTGGRCMYVRWHRNKHAGGVMINCADFTGRGAPLQLGTNGSPTELVTGRVRSDIATVELRFADGARLSVKPTQTFVLATIPKAHLLAGHQLVAVYGLTASGKAVGHESFRPRKR